MKHLARWLWLPFLLCLTSATLAHDSRPLYIEMKEIQAGIIQMKWKMPPSLPYNDIPVIELPDHCAVKGDMVESVTAAATSRRATWLCDGDLSGQQLVIRYPGANPSLSTLVRYHGISGQQHTSVLSPDTRVWTVPDAETPSRVVKYYTLMGIEHIWAGIDHLLFLVCLLWIAGTWRRVLITVTGFTVAHSITLALSALQLVKLPIGPVEAFIALSIVFLAREIIVGRKDSLTWRYPVAVSSSFGLLHGFGFANVLFEVGLPQTEVPLALLFFNVGVEIGQVLFVLAVIGLGWLAGRAIRYFNFMSLLDRRRQAGLVVVYLVGVLSSFWLFERIYGFV